MDHSGFKNVINYQAEACLASIVVWPWLFGPCSSCVHAVSRELLASEHGAENGVEAERWLFVTKQEARSKFMATYGVDTVLYRMFEMCVI